MAEYSPHYNLFKIIDLLKGVEKKIFWLIFILSATSIAIQNIYFSLEIKDIINNINIICIGLFFIIEIIVDYILIPQADSKRRDDFIDNAFGSKFSPIPSKGYYDTEGIEKGLYKASCNLFENCFFSYSLVKAMTIKKTIIPSVTILFLAIFAYYGFKQVPIALTILQTFLSATIFGDLIRHFILLTRLSKINDDWIILFQNENLINQIHKYQPHIYRLWLQYETLHSRIPAGISNELFNKHNERLTQDWNSLKIRYNII